MGYTHYYTIKNWSSESWQAAWTQLICDVPLIIEASDVLVTGNSSDEPDDALTVLPPVADLAKGIYFNGVAEDSHEPFRLSKGCRDHFVKTLMKPYDTPVACILLRAYLLAPENAEVLTDGWWNSPEWRKARDLYEELWPGKPISCPWGEEDDEAAHWRASRNPGAPSAVAVAAQPGKGMPRPVPRPSTVANIDFGPVRKWLSHCNGDPAHDDCKPEPLQWQQLPGVQLRVIDVDRLCVTEVHGESSFVALTYVWGGVHQPMLTADTAAGLMCDGGLGAIWDELPTTIRDAIDVCKELGERYLWIDALCIMQDSIRDKKIQILRMRQIYSSAKCTIAAVAAESADVGLMGSAPLTQSCDSVEGLESIVDASPWSTRAWCYQEKVLSHRAVLFTSAGVYMKCQRNTHDANGNSLASDGSGTVRPYNTSGGMLKIPLGDGVESYFSAVEYYSQRKLTNGADKLNAFQGIIKRYGGIMDGKSSSLYYGLPACAFDQAFCWRTRRHSPQLRNTAFPSWSWLGWNETVTFDRRLLRALQTDQMIHSDQFAFSIGGPDPNLPRKPASLHLYCSQGATSQFGFPAADIMFYNEPELTMYASLADLRIGASPVETEGSNGRYEVFPTTCGQTGALAYFEESTLYSNFKPVPDPDLAGEEIVAGRRVPLHPQTVVPHDALLHDGHGKCEARTPLGYVWLDKEWRAKRQADCFMQFMAVAGEKDAERPGQWVITMLMCLQLVEHEDVWRWERVQVMDCTVREEDWLNFQNVIRHVRLV